MGFWKWIGNALFYIIVIIFGILIITDLIEKLDFFYIIIIIIALYLSYEAGKNDVIKSLQDKVKVKPKRRKKK